MLIIPCQGFDISTFIIATDALKPAHQFFVIFSVPHTNTRTPHHVAILLYFSMCSLVFGVRPVCARLYATSHAQLCLEISNIYEYSRESNKIEINKLEICVARNRILNARPHSRGFDTPIIGYCKILLIIFNFVVFNMHFTCPFINYIEK